MTNFQPCFAYDSAAPSAQEIMSRWTQDFRFLPMFCREPEKIKALVIAFLQRQAGINPVPICGTHRTRMALLGAAGEGRKQCKHRLTIEETVQSTKHGFIVANGIFRCPAPGCFRVERIWDLGTIQPA